MPVADRSGRCEAASLPEPCRADERVLGFLELACRLCPELGDPAVADDGSLRHTEARHGRFGSDVKTSGPCLDTTQDKGVFSELALALVAIPGMAGVCPIGWWAAYLVSLQYTVSTRVLDLPPGINASADSQPFSWASGFDLLPFPLWSEERSLGEQIDFHSNFMAAHLLLCDDVHKTESFRGRYVLRAAHDKPEYHCAVRSSEHLLVKRCRERRRQQHFAGMRGFAVGAQLRSDGAALAAPLKRQGPSGDSVASLRCPSVEAQAAFAMRRASTDGGVEAWARRSEAAVAKYGERAVGTCGRPGRGCEEAAAEWRYDLRIYHKCVLVVVLERLQPAPGAAVLDWGAGCGHKLTWASQLYDVDGLGIDVVEDSVNWASRHSAGTYCQLDGRYVDWLPDDFFDLVLSYAALTHLHPDDQCRVVTELVGKVRVGGRLWFGWNSPNILNANEAERPEQRREEFWSACFASAMREQTRWSSGSISAAWETLTEAHLFPDDFLNHETYLFWPPAYSLFITRIPAEGLEPYF